MHQFNPATVYHPEDEARGSTPTDTGQAPFGQLPQSDLRQLVAAMVD